MHSLSVGVSHASWTRTSKRLWEKIFQAGHLSMRFFIGCLLIGFYVMLSFSEILDGYLVLFDYYSMV